MGRLIAAGALMVALVAGPGAAAHDEFRFIGSLSKMNAAGTRLSVTFMENGKQETVEVAITAKTAITRDKKTIARTALKVGLYVVVDALGDDYDDLEATEIRVVPPPKK
jgi:hypothetical protein